MDFTNINDPAGVKALLDQLRTSQAWQELSTNTASNPSGADSNYTSQALASNTKTNLNPPVESDSEPESEPSPFVSNHISSLLSRLQPGGSVPPVQFPTTRLTSHAIHEVHHHSVDTPTLLTPHDTKVDLNGSTPMRPSAVQTKPLRSLTFGQTLPVIAQLSEDSGFMEKIEKMRTDQAHLERKLWEEREQILKSQEEKIKVAQAKATIIGTGISRSEANSLKGSFRNELTMFYSERALPAWDALVAQQQGTLQALGVPGMFMSAIKADREKQQRIIQVLDGLSCPTDEDME